MRSEYDGMQLVDSAGERIGTIERSYVDDNNVVRFIDVKLGSIVGRHHLVPADRAEETSDGIRVPFVRDVVEESPTVSAGDTLEGDDLTRVRAYYAEDYGSTPDHSNDAGLQSEQHGAAPVSEAEAASSDERNRPPSDFGTQTEIMQSEERPEIGRVRDLGDIIEVPIVEEVLVKKSVVKEVLRIRKSRFTETGIAEADLRREAVEVIPSESGLVDAESETTKH